MFGWRKRIGFISPTVMEVIPQDFYRIAPEGVGLVGVTCNIDDWKAEEYDKALEIALKMGDYLASRNVDFIIHSGVPLVASRGKGFDRELTDAIQERTGIPTIQTVHAAMQAMEHLNMKKIALASPYPDETQEWVAQFLNDYGFDVVKKASMKLGFKECQDIPWQSIYHFAGQVVREAPEIDGLYMPCPQWPILDAIEWIERDFKKPVVAADPADFWAAFKALGIREPISGYGQLLDAPR